MKVNKKGVSGFEVLVVIFVYAAVFCIISFVIINSVNKTKFKTLRYDAVAFSYNVRTYITYNKLDFNRKIYLNELVNYDNAYNITSPFDSNNKCSLIDSYVTMKNNKILVTLKCDNYMLYEYDLDNKEYDIYYVSEWMDVKPNTNNIVDIIKVYNYKKNNNYMLEEFVPYDIFINKYNELENKNVSNLNNIILYEEKTYYRERKVVSNVVD